MSTNPLPASGDSSAKALKERLQRLEQDLIRQRKRVDGSTTLTTIVGIIVLAAIGGFFYFGYKEVSIFRDPKMIVDYGESFLDDNIPQLRARLESEIVQSAPQWAATLSKEALGYLPVGRQRLEKMAMEYTDEAMKETRSMTNEKFKAYFAAHHKELEKKFEELAKSSDLAENSLLDIQADLEKDLQVDLKADAEVLLKEITKYNRIFKRMKEGKGLNKEDQLGRQSWMLARAIRREGLDLGTTGLPDISANSKPDRNIGERSPGSTGSKSTKKQPIPSGKEDNKKDKAEQKKDKAADGDKKKDDSKTKE